MSYPLILRKVSESRATFPADTHLPCPDQARDNSFRTGVAAC
jgi:hypothetical protein